MKLKHGGGGGDGGNGDRANLGGDGDGEGSFGAVHHRVSSNSTAADSYSKRSSNSNSRSPLFSTVDRVSRFASKRGAFLALLTLRALHTLKQHFLPLYLATALLLAVPARLNRRSLQIATQLFLGLAAASGVTSIARTRVRPLVPPIYRQDSRQHRHDAAQNTGSANNSSSNSSNGEAYALVTGASSGIGKEIAAELASLGWNLILIGRHHEVLRAQGKELKRAARSHGRQLKVHVIEADLATSTAAEEVYDEVHRAGLSIEVLVNCAGQGWISKFSDAPGDRLEDILTLNCISTSGLTHLFAQDFVQARRGRILIMSSIAGSVPSPRAAVYGATKAYLSSFAQALQIELEPLNVGVTCVLPGPVKTNFEANSNAQGARAFRLPHYTMSPKDVAHQVRNLLKSADTTNWRCSLLLAYMAVILESCTFYQCCVS